MNNTELKTNFYKRFWGVSGHLSFCAAGFPVSLLGYAMSDYTDCIGVGLSMRIGIMARKTGDRDIMVTSTDSDACRRYRPDGKDGKIRSVINRAADYKLSGGQMLVDNSILPVFDAGISYSAAFLKAAFEISDIQMPPSVMAQLLAKKNEKNAYLILFTAEPGYCARAGGTDAIRLPFPMNGYKFMLMTDDVKGMPITSSDIETAYKKMKEIYRGISSLCDISDEMLLNAVPRLNSFKCEHLIRHLADENKRIQEAQRVLLGCNTKKFAQIMNNSFYSQKQVISSNDSMVFLGDIALDTGGIIGVRICDSGVVAIVDADACDYAAGMIKTRFEREFSRPPVICVANTM